MCVRQTISYNHYRKNTKTKKKTNHAALGIFFETSFGLSGWCTSMEMFLAVNFSMSPVVAPQKTQTNLERFRGRDVEDRNQRPAPSMLRKRLQCFKNIMTHDSCHYCLLDLKKLFKKKSNSNYPPSNSCILKSCWTTILHETWVVSILSLRYNIHIQWLGSTWNTTPGRSQTNCCSRPATFTKATAVLPKS